MTFRIPVFTHLEQNMRQGDVVQGKREGGPALYRRGKGLLDVFVCLSDIAPQELEPAGKVKMVSIVKIASRV